MAEQIPLNNFRLIITSLDSGSNVIYQETEKNVDTILLSLHLANITDELQRATVKVESGSQQVHIIKNAPIPAEDTLNPFAGRIALEAGNSLIVEVSQSNAIEATLSVLENANE
jgi:chromosome condensin MukBEF complex kleisin-like MukF subunit